MSLNIVQFATGGGTSSIPSGVTNHATFTATFSSPVTTGNSIMLFTAGNAGFANYVLGVTAVTDTESNNYGIYIRNDIQTGGALFAKPLAMGIWYIPSVTGGSSFTISVTWSQESFTAGPNDNYYNIVAMELVNAGPSSSVISANGGNTAGGAGHPETATITNSLSATIVVNFVLASGQPNGWEAMDLYGPNGDFLLALQDDGGGVGETIPTATGYTFYQQVQYNGAAGLFTLWTLGVPFGPPPPPPSSLVFAFTNN
jgi:hypothetical protein